MKSNFAHNKLCNIKTDMLKFNLLLCPAASKHERTRRRSNVFTNMSEFNVNVWSVRQCAGHRSIALNIPMYIYINLMSLIASLVIVDRFQTFGYRMA